MRSMSWRMMIQEAPEASCIAGLSLRVACTLLDKRQPCQWRQAAGSTLAASAAPPDLAAQPIALLQTKKTISPPPIQACLAYWPGSATECPHFLGGLV